MGWSRHQDGRGNAPERIRRVRAAGVVALAWVVSFLAAPLLHAVGHSRAHDHHAGGLLLSSAASHGHGHTPGVRFAPRGPWSGRAVAEVPLASVPGTDAPPAVAPTVDPRDGHPGHGLDHGAGSGLHLAATLLPAQAPDQILAIVAHRDAPRIAVPPAPVPTRFWRAVAPARGPPTA